MFGWIIISEFLYLELYSEPIDLGHKCSMDQRDWGSHQGKKVTPGPSSDDNDDDDDNDENDDDDDDDYEYVKCKVLGRALSTTNRDSRKKREQLFIPFILQSPL